jgi:hypothetical protein
MDSPASLTVSRSTTLAPLFAQSPAEKQHHEQQQALAPVLNSGNATCLSPSHTGRGLDTTKNGAGVSVPAFLPVAPSPLSQTQLQFTQSQYAAKKR